MWRSAAAMAVRTWSRNVSSSAAGAATASTVAPLQRARHAACTAIQGFEGFHVTCTAAWTAPAPQ